MSSRCDGINSAILDSVRVNRQSAVSRKKVCILYICVSVCYVYTRGVYIRIFSF